MEFTSEAAMAATCLIHEHRGKLQACDAGVIDAVEFGPMPSSRLLDVEPFRIPYWLARPLISSGLWIQHHLQLMCSGETPHVHVSFSLMVALSSLLYLVVAYAYWLHQCPITTLMFVGVTITSLFSDSLNPGSKTWCCLDRSLATFGVFIGPLRALVFYTEGILEQVTIVGLSLFSVMFLAWSRTSKNQNEFVLRHSCWHAVSSACLLWLAFNCPPVP